MSILKAVFQVFSDRRGEMDNLGLACKGSNRLALKFTALVNPSQLLRAKIS